MLSLQLDDHAQQIVSSEVTLELGERYRAALEQVLADPTLRFAAGDPEGAGVGEADPPAAPRRQVGGQERPERLPDRGDVVLGGEPAELEQRLVEHRSEVDDALDGAGLEPFGALLVDAQDDSGQQSLADRGSHPHSGRHHPQPGRRNRVRQRPMQGNRNRDLGPGGRCLPPSRRLHHFELDPSPGSAHR